ncbi:HU family DNA-binding protein [soil metagenome]
MTKAQIVDRVADATGLTKIETEAVIDGFLFTVMEAVKDGEMVEIRGFGTLRPRERAQRSARNPRTDEPVEVPRRYVPVFKPALEFRDGVNAARMAAESGNEVRGGE